MRNLIVVVGIVVVAAFAAGAACSGDDSSGCTPNCSGFACGWDPVCGTMSCGTCPTGQTCTTYGTCQSTTTNPTYQEGCMALQTAACQKHIACGSVCTATGVAITDVEACYVCNGSRDICATVANPSGIMTDAEIATVNRCIADISPMSCDDLWAGRMPPTCS